MVEGSRTLIDHLELAVRNLEQSGQALERLGFWRAGKRSEQARRSWLYMQGEIRIVLTASSSERDDAFRFTRAHGDGIYNIGLRVADVEAARHRGQARSVGDVQNSFVAIDSRARIEDLFLEERGSPSFMSGRYLQATDHLTFKVEPGQLAQARALYSDLLGHDALRLIDIQTDAGLGIKPFTASFQGAGIERVALHAANIELCVDDLKARGISFYEYPESECAILTENTEGGSLSQAFTRPMLGALSFEVIQRKGGTGFGEANRKLLISAIRREQNHLGVLA